MRNYPEGEKKELIEIYTDRGMDPEDARIVTDIISKNEEAWINIMMVEDLGIVEDNSSPLKNAVATALTGITLFALGALKTRFTTQNWFMGGIEMLGVGGLASGAAYLIGLVLGSLA